MLVRRERADDPDVISGIHRRAFAAGPSPGEGEPREVDAEPVEVGLVRALRADAAWVPALSLVAEDRDGRPVGHVVATEGRIGDVVAVGLGPIGVVPEAQGRGVGHALMHAVLGAADALGYPAVAVLGHPAFYRRFGFVEASSLGVAAPDPAWGGHFQLRTLAAWDAAEARGPFRYAAPFEGL